MGKINSTDDRSCNQGVGSTRATQSLLQCSFSGGDDRRLCGRDPTPPHSLCSRKHTTGDQQGWVMHAGGEPVHRAGRGGAHPWGAVHRRGAHAGHRVLHLPQPRPGVQPLPHSHFCHQQGALPGISSPHPEWRALSSPHSHNLPTTGAFTQYFTHPSYFTLSLPQMLLCTYDASGVCPGRSTWRAGSSLFYMLTYFSCKASTAFPTDVILSAALQLSFTHIEHSIIRCSANSSNVFHPSKSLAIGVSVC